MTDEMLINAQNMFPVNPPSTKVRMSENVERERKEKEEEEQMQHNLIQFVDLFLFPDLRSFYSFISLDLLALGGLPVSSDL